MKRGLLLLLVAFAPLLKTDAEAIIRFTNLNGIPDVIHQGQGYTLSGYLVNDGTNPSSAVLDINMKINGEDVILLDNNFNVGSGIRPGDTVFWSVANFVFPGASFREGNNDVLIWPTGPGNNDEFEDIGKPVFFSTKAAFLTTSDMVKTSTEKINYSEPQTLLIKTVNLGKGRSMEPITFYAEIAPGHRIALGKIGESCASGDSVIYYHNEPFNLSKLIEQFAPEYRSQVHDVKFWAQEDKFVPPIGKGQKAVEISPDDLANGPSDELVIAGNPVSNYLHLVTSLSRSEQITGIRLLDVKGNLVKEVVGFEEYLDVQTLSEGLYFVQVQFGEDQEILKFVKH